MLALIVKVVVALNKLKAVEPSAAVYWVPHVIKLVVSGNALIIKIGEEIEPATKIVYVPTAAGTVTLNVIVVANTGWTLVNETKLASGNVGNTHGRGPIQPVVFKVDD
jgi:hypothetical protein